MGLLDVLSGLWRRDAAPPAPALPQRRDSTINPFTGLGGAGDKGAVARPNPWVQPLTSQELSLLWAHNGIARRITEIVPQRACRRGWMVPDIGAEDERLQTWSRVGEAMSMARLYGGSVLLMVTEDDVPAGMGGPDWLAQPIDLARVGKLVALQVFDATEASPLAWDTDPRSLGFRLPSMWHLTTQGWSAQVHASRVVHFRGARRPPGDLRRGTVTGMPDMSVLQAIWDEIRRLTETLQGGAVLAQEIRESVLKITDFADRTTGDEADAVEARISQVSRTKSLLGIVFVGEGEDYQNRSNPPTGFDTLTSAGWEALAAVTGIPQVILMGSTPGGLNTDGESSWEGFRQLVSSYQDSHRHDLQRMYRVVYAAQDGPTRGRIPEGGIPLEFAPLDEPNTERASVIRRNTAATDALYTKAGVLSVEEVRRSRFGPQGWALDILPVPPAPPAPPPVAAAPGAVPAVPAVEGDREGQRAEAGRVDAITPDGVSVLVPVADPGLRARVEAAIGQPLTGGDDPHVTVLYLGGGLDAAALDEVRSVVHEEAARASVRSIDGAVLTTFGGGPGGLGGTPVVVEYTRRADLRTLHERLLRRLAHRVTAQQHPTYRPHLTLGYAAQPVEADAAARLAAIDVSGLVVPVTLVEVRQGGRLVERVSVGRWR